MLRQADFGGRNDPVVMPRPTGDALARQEFGKSFKCSFASRIPSVTGWLRAAAVPGRSDDAVAELAGN